MEADYAADSIAPSPQRHSVHSRLHSIVIKQKSYSTEHGQPRSQIGNVCAS